LSTPQSIGKVLAMSKSKGASAPLKKAAKSAVQVAKRAAGSTKATPKALARSKGAAAKGAKAKAAAKPGRSSRPEPARVAQIIAGLKDLYPDVKCELDHENAFQLTVATILSAQSTDKRVNMVTPEVFRRWPDAAALASADPAELEQVIHSTGFFRNKAKSLLGMARRLVEHHGGEVPRTMEEMLELPGVARKTSNVVLGTAYGIASGVVVDTHVMRLSRLLGLTQAEDPVKIELDLQQIVPKDEWIDFSHRLIWHGRRVCIANRPKCAECPLPCPSRQTTQVVP
jgi:endonuclease-3